MRVAIYSSVLYGEDYIVESIKSVIDFVDKVYVILVDRPWGLSKGIRYKDEWIDWPEKFDGTEDKVASLPGVSIIRGYKYTPWCRHPYGAMLVLGKSRVKATEILFMDPDCIFLDGCNTQFFNTWSEYSDCQWAVPRQIDLWKTCDWQIIRDRPMISIHRGDLSILPGICSSEIFRYDIPSHNLGFCVSDKTMFWKHLTSLAFSEITGESIPNVDWYAEKWLKWHPVTNNKDLEISLGNESSIPMAVPYDDVPISNDVIKVVNKIRFTNKEVFI